MTGHLVFNGPTRTLKAYLVAAPGATPELRHQLEAHDVGVNDGALADPYGHLCKCPPGLYFVGAPMHLDPPEVPYGRRFIPLSDDPIGDKAGEGFAAHGRAGIGIHGGGSGLADPFAPRQGWQVTFGCLRLQNEDLEQQLVPFIETVRKNATGDPDRAITLSVYWGDRTSS